jgi:hypothetical protein
MSAELAIQELAERLTVVENELRAVQKELALGKSKSDIGRIPAGEFGDLFSDKSDIRKAMDELVSRLNFKGPVLSPEELQQKMREAGLESNEFSEGIIAMREE